MRKTMQLKFAILGTLWIAVVVVAWFWTGQILIHDEAAAFFYYTFGLLVAGGLSATPFIIYRETGEKDRNERY